MMMPSSFTTRMCLSLCIIFPSSKRASLYLWAGKAIRWAGRNKTFYPGAQEAPASLQCVILQTFVTTRSVLVSSGQSGPRRQRSFSSYLYPSLPPCLRNWQSGDHNTHSCVAQTWSDGDWAEEYNQDTILKTSLRREEALQWSPFTRLLGLFMMEMAFFSFQVGCFHPWLCFLFTASLTTQVFVFTDVFPIHFSINIFSLTPKSSS